MSKEFAAIEEAAMKAYQEDLKRLGAKTGSTVSENTKTTFYAFRSFLF